MHKLISSFSLFLLFLSIPSLLFAQLRGEIRDASTNEPVSFAYVHLEEINRTTTADRNGSFRFKNVPEGSYVISVHRIGYTTFTREIEYTGPETDPLLIP